MTIGLSASSSETTRVDFHCHSSHSDGFYSPQALVALLAAAHVRYAALTDHDTTEGLVAFTDACARNNIACISGLEMTVGEDDEPLHLLAYGFDPDDRPLQEALARTRERRATRQQTGLAFMGVVRSPPPAVAQEALEDRSWIKRLAQAIQLIHDASGRAFLAHPLALTQDLELLDAILEQAREVGLDGIEAFYWRHSAIERRALVELAEKHGLLVCGGSDYHGPERGGPLKPGIDIPTPIWKDFRDAVIASSPDHVADHAPRPAISPLGDPKGFVLRIVVPSLLTIVLFITAIFAIVLPETERLLLERKRETIRELTSSAWSVLEDAHHLETEGSLTREQAQHEALEQIRAMRYGPERKDYFWITDQKPEMVMHPYRTELEGHDLSTYADPNGVLVFVEFVRLVQERQEGYVQYAWQWKDDPTRISPKESYIKGFEPWGWIVGTGLYVQDVRREITRLSERLVNVAAGISIAVVLLVLVILQQSLSLERRRQATAQALTESYEKYRALVEASTAATLLVIDKRCTTANVVAQEMLGYTTAEFALLDISDLMEPAAPTGRTPDADDPLARVLSGQECPLPFEARLRRKDGKLRDVVLTASRVSFAGREGLIVNARDVSRQEQIEEALDVIRGRFRALTGNLDLGVFHADNMEDGWRLLDLNAAGRRIFAISAEEELPRYSLDKFFKEREEGRAFLKTLREEGQVRRLVVWMKRADGETVLVSLSATLGRYGLSRREYCDGLIEDVTERKRAESDRESVIAELQSSLLFLNEPLRHYVGSLPTCTLEESIETVATRMTRERQSAVVVTSESGSVVGIVTDRDFRDRVLVAGRNPKTPIHEIMSAPVVAVEQRALVYEAVLLMQERNIRHLAVRDEAGRIISLVRAKDLIRFDRYSASVLTDQLRRAESVEKLADGQRRLPVLVKGLIDSGTNIRAITRVTTIVSDTISERLIHLAFQEIGPPPCPFAFLALGSEGRGEQTLVTDQDNAIVFADADPETTEANRTYFLRLGTLVCDGLNTAGYAWCRGNLMAKNPQWTQPLSSWKKTYEGWIDSATPQELVDINKFFDFRAVQGDQELVEDLRGHIGRAVRSKAAFMKHFAENALLMRPPVGIFGQLQTGSGRARPGRIDLKFVQMLIISFARLYALNHEIRETNTVSRLEQMHELGLTGAKQHREMVQSYDFLMRLRLGHQVRAMTRNLPPDNDIDPEELTLIEQKMLKQILAQISGMQTRISHDFNLVS